MALARIDWWVRASALLALVHATLLAVVHMRPGLPGVVLWFVGPPLVALGAAALLAVAFVRTLKRRVATRHHLAAYLLLGAVVASLALVRTYPSSHDGRPSDARFRLPLDGPVTVAWGGATLGVNYHAVMPDQRWAYDMLVTHEGRTHRGEGTRVEDYYAYGLPVLAPADGVVHATRDGDPDEAPGYWRIRRVTGNHVVLEVAPDEYLFIAHLQPGSIRVTPGERVRAGQVIGLVGNSGNTTEPHVHLHLQDTPRTYLGEAIPFDFHDYRLGDVHVERGTPTGGQRRRRGVTRGEYTGQVVEHAGRDRLGTTAPETIIRHVTVVTPHPEPLLANAEIHIRGGAIARVRPATTVPVPPGVALLDGGGRVVLPGLVDLHQHATVVSERPGAWLAHGVTTVRDPGGNLTIGRRLRNRIASGEAAGPRLFLGLTIDAGPDQTAATIRARISAEAARGLDLVKLYLRTPIDDARAAIDEAGAHGLPVTWHLGPGLGEALDLGVNGVEHLYLFRELMPPPDEAPPVTTSAAFRQIYARWAQHLSPTTAEAQALFRRMTASGVVWTPTLVLHHAIAGGSSEYSRDWSVADRAIGAAGFARACEMVGEAHRQGVRIGAGTDTEDPADLHRELALLVGCGLSPRDALASGTSIAAVALRQEGRLGAIVEGAAADLVIVDGNPVERIDDTARVWRVVQAGRVIPPGDPGTRLDR